ncbi:MAG TPA: hypothetical protein VGK74_08320 [Symbiobacteriaceae bacterium]
MAVQVLGFPTTQGMPRTALRHGPEALRVAGLVERLTRRGFNVEDLGDLVVPEGRSAIRFRRGWRQWWPQRGCSPASGGRSTGPST